MVNKKDDFDDLDDLDLDLPDTKAGKKSVPFINKKEEPDDGAHIEDTPESNEKPEAKTPEPQNEPLPPLGTAPPKSTGRAGKIATAIRTLLFVILGAIIMGAAAFGGWYGYEYFMNRDDDDTAETSSEGTEGAESEAADDPSASLVSAPTNFSYIAYAHGAILEGSSSLYTRPFTGGDRIELSSVDVTEDINKTGLYATSVSKKFAFSYDENQIWVGDTLHTPELVHTHEVAGEEIGSIMISPDGEKVAYSIIDTNDKSTDVYTLNSDGSEAGLAFSLDGYTLVKLVTWHADRNKSIAFQAYECVDCDGGAGPTYSYDFSQDAPTVTSEGITGPIVAYDMDPYSGAQAFVTGDTEQRLYVHAPYSTGPVEIDSYTSNLPIRWLNAEQPTLAYGKGTNLMLWTNDSNETKNAFTHAELVDRIYGGTVDGITIGTDVSDGTNLSYVNLGSNEATEVMETSFTTTNIFGLLTE